MIGKRRDAGAAIATFFIVAAFYGVVTFLGCTAVLVMGPKFAP